MIKPLLADMVTSKQQAARSGAAKAHGKTVNSKLAVFLNNFEPIYTLNLELQKNIRKTVRWFQRLNEFATDESCCAASGLESE